MSGLATDPIRATARARGSNRGSALLSAVVVFVVIFGLAFASVLTSTTDMRDSRGTLDDVRARYLAESGFERGMKVLADAAKLNNARNPVQGIQNLFLEKQTITPFIGEPMVDGTTKMGAVTVTMTSVEQTANSVTVDIEATGYLPDAPANLAPGGKVSAWNSILVRVRYDLKPSEVFDYAYFINNWGWFYGNTIYANGNVRSNGQFDAAGYSPGVNGQPLYDSLNMTGGLASLSGYHDDNLDGLLDGNDGGIWSGWDIVGAQNVQGTGGNAANQHDFQDPVDMPNLSDLYRYEELASSEGSSISVNGSIVASGVYGDEAGESQNLYLIGTAADPVVVDGAVVVRGDVIISGYVTGQGSIFSGGNVYVPDSIHYLDPPTTARPAGTTQAETEQWLTDNADRDFLGLFARENVVVGDHTNRTWRHYVGGWMASSLNQSAEDSGEDGIPNTIDGRDGIPGTADDDVLEGDGSFSIEYYTAEQEALGLLPPGASVGDPIPGTGEDIDGDGFYDGTCSLADVDFSVPLDDANWGGNMPVGGIADYSEIASLYANHLDAVFYTNHSFCYLVLGNHPAEINGALVSRNEDIVYGTPCVAMNHDSRLLAGGSGLPGNLLPTTMGPPTVLRWSVLDRDPNRYLGVQP